MLLSYSGLQKKSVWLDLDEFNGVFFISINTICEPEYWNIIDDDIYSITVLLGKHLHITQTLTGI